MSTLGEKVFSLLLIALFGVFYFIRFYYLGINVIVFEENCVLMRSYVSDKVLYVHRN